MIGITAAGSAFPAGRYRDGDVSRAVAGSDEDAVTLAAEAADACLGDTDRKSIDAIYFATGSSPWAERSAAALLARFLELPAELRAVDFSGTLGSATRALGGALDALEAGTAKRLLLVAADARVPPLHGEISSDGAVALLLETEGGFGRFSSRASVRGCGAGPYRMSGEVRGRGKTDKIYLDTAYRPAMSDALKLLFCRCELEPDAFARVVLDAPDGFGHLDVGDEFGLLESDRLFEGVGLGIGHCGAAHPLLILLSALSEAEAQDRILFATWGDGADAFVVEATGDAPNLLTAALARNYVINREEVRRRHASRAEPARISGESLGELGPAAQGPFLGSACESCGGVYAMSLRVCPSCRERDAFSRVRLGRSGLVYSYTVERKPGEEPAAFALVNLMGGGRALLPVTDAGLGRFGVGAEVDVVLRRIYDTEAGPVYHYKVRPSGGGR